MAAKSTDRSRQSRALLQPLQRAQHDPAGDPVPSPERLDERGLRRQTLYLPPEVHEQIRDYAISKRWSQQQFFREAIDFFFREKLKMKGWSELVPPKKRRT